MTYTIDYVTPEAQMRILNKLPYKTPASECELALLEAECKLGHKILATKHKDLS